jgi:hypothetical protein
MSEVPVAIVEAIVASCAFVEESRGDHSLLPQY